MNLSSKFIIVLIVIVAVALIFTATTLLNNGLAPLEQKEYKTTTTATKNVTLNAETFNGDIIITTSTSDEIEVTYNIQAHQGHINEITTATTNKTLNENTEITTQAKIINPNNQLKVNYR
jgi:hypothetical protein